MFHPIPGTKLLILQMIIMFDPYTRYSVNFSIGDDHV